MFVDIVFDGPPGPETGRFVEVENQQLVIITCLAMLRQGYKSETVLGNAATVTAARQASVMAKEITLREHLASIASKGGTARGEKQSAKCKQAIAKKGGKTGGKAGAAALSPARRKQIAKKAAAKRWKNK